MIVSRIVERLHDTVNSDTDNDISFDDNISDSADHDKNDVGGDAGGDSSDEIHSINISPFTQPTAPRNMLLSGASELAYSMLLITVDMILHLVTETNRYAAQCQAARGVRDLSWYDKP